MNIYIGAFHLSNLTDMGDCEIKKMQFVDLSDI